MMKEVESDVPAVDRLSDLPNDIKHDILSRLNTRDAVRTCVFSKEWRDEWTWLPYLSFSKRILPYDVQVDEKDTYLPRKKSRLQEIHRKKEAFCNFMDQAFQRRANTKLPYKLQKLSLYVPSSHEALAPHIDRWLACAAKCSVTKLHLDAGYQVPESVFHVCFLTWLKLSRCKILLYHPHMISLSSLKKLSLSMVNVDEQALKSIITSCCAIKKLSLVYCSGFNDLEICGVPKLQKVKVIGNQRLKVVVSDAMHLQFCTFRGFRVDVATCKNIRCLKLDKVALTDEQLSLHLSVLHLLEDLFLIQCIFLRSVEISAPNLRYFCVIDCKLHEANIAAPKLEYFTYCAEDIISLSLNVPSLASAAITIRHGNTNNVWVARFLEFLTKFNCCKELTLHINPNLNMCLPLESRSTLHSPLLNVGHLKVQLGIVAVFHPLAQTIDTILWLSPRPDSITVQFLSLDCYKIKFHFMYNELIDGEEEQDHSCCSSIPIKCWRHCLKEVNIENLRDGEDTAKLKDLFETSKALERIEGLPVKSDSCLNGWRHRPNPCLFFSTIPPVMTSFRRS